SSYHHPTPPSRLRPSALIYQARRKSRKSPYMNYHTFINREQFAYARDPPKDNHTHLPPLGDWPQDVFLQILGNCPPLTLVVSRQVCKVIKQALDDNPSVWIESRAKISWPPPPPSALGNGSVAPTEWAWASHVARGVFSGTLEWSTQYRAQYIIYKDYNLERCVFRRPACPSNQPRRVRVNLRKLLPEHSGETAIARIVANHLRTPSCLALLRAFNHSLEVIPDAAWNNALPAMRRELGLISSCDPAKLPPSYLCDNYDRILCPTCHPRPLATRWRVTQLKTNTAKYRWFAENTIRVHEIHKHYKTKYVWFFYSQPPVEPYRQSSRSLTRRPRCSPCAQLLYSLRRLLSLRWPGSA
ncbi:hypothetical protein EV122DRAFT_226036, partial [Schizophyllum commune]